MKGGYNGIRDRRGDECPICNRQYEHYVPADSDSGDISDKPIESVCTVVNYGGYASGGYVHLAVETPDNTPISSEEATR